MQGSFQYPYCGMIMSLSESTYSTQYPSFENVVGYYSIFPGKEKVENSCLQIDFYKCPNCNQYSIIANGIGTAVKDVMFQFVQYHLQNNFLNTYQK